MRSALETFVIAGVPTTIPFHRDVLCHDDFRSGRVTTRWVEEKFLASASSGRPRPLTPSEVGARP
jgi:biotin carboxylase